MTAKALLPLLGLTSLLAVACGAGDRALDSAFSGHDTCPSGETCSASTPGGLKFQRTQPKSNLTPAPLAVARGGYEDVRISRADGHVYLSVFDAKTTDQALLASPTGSDTVRVTGDHAGASYLRIVDHGTDALEDRLHLEVMDVARVDIRIAGLTLPPATTEIGVMHGATVTADAVPMAAGDHELADDGLTTTTTATGVTARASDGTTASLSIAQVDAIDAITFFAFPGLQDGMPTMLGVRQPAYVCAVATSGGRPTLGETITVTATNTVDVSVPLSANCFGMVGVAAGQATVTATAGSLTASFTLTVSEAQQKQSVGAPARATGHGERAAASLAAE